MRLDALFPRWCAAATNSQIPWDHDFDPAASERFGGLLALIVSDQSSSSMQRPQEFEPICRAVVEDILALRAALPEGGDPTDLLYLQFDASLVPLRMALNLGELGGAHDWIVTGLGDDLAHGVERAFSPGRLEVFETSETKWIANNRASTVADWAFAFFYLCRRAATFHVAARMALPAVVRILEPLPETDPKAIEARCMIVNWASVYLPDVASVLARRLEKAFDLPDLGLASRTRIAVMFAGNGRGLTDRAPAEWAAWALGEGAAALGSHEPFQLIWHQVATVEDWHRLKPATLAAARHYAASLRGLGSPTAIAKATDQRSGLLGPAFLRMTEFGRSDDLVEILACWYDVPADVSLATSVLFVSPNHRSGTAFLGARSRILPAAGSHILAELTAITNQALGLAITVQGEIEGAAVPQRAGQPDYALGPRFQETLEAAYRLKEIDPEVLADRRGLIAFPGQPHPLQAMLAGVRDRRTLPISASLQQPTADRPLRRALIWSADNDLFAGFEADAVQQILEGAGVACERRSGEGARPADFLAAYSDPGLDIVWVAGHGEIDHWRDGSARLMTGVDCFVSIDELVANTPQIEERRLLMLNICDGAVAAVNGGIHRLGLAHMLARRTQATISHLWPVRPLMAAAFGTLLAGRLAQRMTSFEAYEAALQSIRAPSADVTGAIREVVPGLGLVDRLEATDLDSENIFNWGSPAFFQ